MRLFRRKSIALLLVVGLFLAATVPALAADTFDYTITATGTQPGFVYPEVTFDWTVTGTGTETFQQTLYAAAHVLSEAQNNSVVDERSFPPGAERPRHN